MKKANKSAGRQKVKRASVRQTREVAAMGGGPQIPLMTDTSNEWYLYFAPGLQLLVNNNDIMPQLQASSDAGAHRVVLKTVDTDSRIAPREGVDSAGKKATFFLQIPKNLRPTN